MLLGFSIIEGSENCFKVSIMRSFISVTALFVNVIAKMFLKRKGLLDANNIFKYSFTSAKVFPLPAEAL